MQFIVTGCRRLWWLYGIFGLLLTACGTGLPVVTPTVAPTHTPDATRIAENATDTPTPIIVFTDTPTPLPTNTPVPTETSTATATGTQTPSVTPSPTATNPPTLTSTPSQTATVTAAPSVTPLPLDTFTPVPASQTPLPSDTPTPLPTATNTPNIVATQNAQILQTRAASSPTPLQPTFTPVALASPTNTLPPPTQDVTPTLITATPNLGIIPTLAITITPIVSTPQIDFTAPTATAFPPITPTAFPVNQIPPTVEVENRQTVSPVVISAFPNTTTIALDFEVGAGQFIYNGNVISRGVSLFAVNPADPNSYATTDNTGVLTLVPIGGSATRLTTSPFVPNFFPESAETNEDFISGLSWSPNGQRLAFIISPPPTSGVANGDAGVWFWDASGGTFVLLHDCPMNGYSSCELTSRPVNNWNTIAVDWSPNSQRVVMTVRVPQEGRQAIFISDMNFGTRRPEAPPFLRWDNAQWLTNSQLLLSGRAPDGRSQIATYDVNSGATNVLYDASTNGLFLADAIQRPNGEIIAVGREGGALDGAYRLYRLVNGTVTPISGFIGNNTPQSIDWSSNYGQAVLTVDGAQYVVSTVTGAVDTATTTGQINISSEPVQPTGDVQILPPSGVIAGNRYDAGQQIQFVGELTRNMRAQPNLTGAFAGVINPGEFVTILAGPYQSDGLIWWEVSNARDVRAWVSVSTVDRSSTFFSP